MHCVSEVNRYHFLLIGRAKRAPHWAVQSRFRVIYIIYMYIRLRLSMEKQYKYAKMRPKNYKRKKERSSETEDHEKQQLATLKRLK